MTDSQTDHPQRVLSPTRARQGRPAKGMMWVLLGGTFLVVAAFAALLAYRAGDFSGATSGNGPANMKSPTGPVPAQTFNAPTPPSPTPDPAAPPRP